MTADAILCDVLNSFVNIVKKLVYKLSAFCRKVGLKVDDRLLESCECICCVVVIGIYLIGKLVFKLFKLFYNGVEDCENILLGLCVSTCDNVNCLCVNCDDVPSRVTLICDPSAKRGKNEIGIIHYVLKYLLVAVGCEEADEGEDVLFVAVYEVENSYCIFKNSNNLAFGIGYEPIIKSVCGLITESGSVCNKLVADIFDVFCNVISNLRLKLCLKSLAVVKSNYKMIICNGKRRICKILNVVNVILKIRD